MKLKPLKVDTKAIIAFQKEYEEKYGENFDAVSHLESVLKKDKQWVTTTRRIKKINNIFK